MPVPPLHVSSTVDPVVGFDLIRAELDLPDGFPDEVLAEAEAAVRDDRWSGRSGRRIELPDVPFVTIDPPSSMDLDQAVSIERARTGFVVRYAIADVAAFVAPEGALDREARRRGTTVYLPDRRTPLHPPLLSEGAASLLPGVDRPALVWEIALDRDGATRRAELRPARIRSRAKCSYAEVQASLDDGTAPEQLQLLAEVGQLRQALEAERGGVSLPLPDQRVVQHEGHYGLEFRAPLAVEGWNAQISLLAGICAAELMLEAGVGVLRTLPPPSAETLDALRRHARALGVDWPTGASYPEVIRSLDMALPGHAAFATQAARLFRGAGYLAFDRRRGDTVATDAPRDADALRHAAVAATYAHVTAPLRRLVDRFANEVVLAHCAGAPIPDWVDAALPELSSLMGRALQRANSADARARDLIEAVVLADRIGDVLDATVVDLDGRGAGLQISEPAILVRAEPHGRTLGETVRIRVVEARPAERSVRVEVLEPR